MLPAVNQLGPTEVPGTLSGQGAASEEGDDHFSTVNPQPLFRDHDSMCTLPLGLWVLALGTLWVPFSGWAEHGDVGLSTLFTDPPV